MTSRLLACILLLASCADSHAERIPACHIDDGTWFAVGEGSRADPCAVCDPNIATDRLTPIWHNGCETSDRLLGGGPGLASGAHLELGARRGGAVWIVQSFPASYARDRLPDDDRGMVFVTWLPESDADGAWDPDPVPVAGRRLGSALSVDGDVNSDGQHDMAVGADGIQRVYLVDGALIRTIGTVDGPDACGLFGAAVSLGPDVDGDGSADLAVAAPGTDGAVEPRCREGRVYLYSGATRELLREVAPPSGVEHLGSAGLVLGVGYRDGDTAALVAGTSSGGGTVVVFDAGTGELLQEWSEEVADGPDAIEYGPDGDGDALPDVVAVGFTAIDSNGRAERSTVRALRRVGGSRHLGSGIAISYGQDADGDGLADVLVADNRDAGSGGRSDRIRIRQILDGDEVWHGGGSGNDFVSAVDFGPDVDGDGRADILAGGPGASTGGFAWAVRVSTQFEEGCGVAGSCP